MRKIIPVVLLTSVFGAYGQLAMARGPSGGGPGAGGSPHIGGPSSNSQAAANSNGRFATDRDKGLERAEDRKSANSKGQPKAAAVKKKEKPVLHSANAATPAVPATRATPAISATPPSPPVPGKLSTAVPALPAVPATPAIPLPK